MAARRVVQRRGRWRWRIRHSRALYFNSQGSHETYDFPNLFPHHLSLISRHRPQTTVRCAGNTRNPRETRRNEETKQRALLLRHEAETPWSRWVSRNRNHVASVRNSTASQTTSCMRVFQFGSWRVSLIEKSSKPATPIYFYRRIRLSTDCAISSGGSLRKPPVEIHDL
jgi:hypothetical protein